MAAIRYSKSLFSFSKLRSQGGMHARPISAFLNQNYFARDSGYATKFNGDIVGLEGSNSLSDDRFIRGKYVSAFGRGLSCSSTRICAPYGGIGSMMNYRAYSSSTGGQNGNPQSEVPAVPADGSFGGNDWMDKVKEFWKSIGDGVSYVGEKSKEMSGEVTPHVQQMLDSHPYLRDVVVPVTGTSVGILLAWIVLPKILRRLHKYSMQGPATLLSGSSLWGSVSYEKSFWGALEDPVRYLITFVALSQMGVMVAPSTIASQYLAPAWKGAVIISLVWFLHRWKSNVINRALAMKSMDGLDRNKLLTLDKLSSVVLFATGLMAFAEACGVAVQSILTVGGIGGVATAFAARDVLGNILSGLSVQISGPFSIGDRIKAGSVEGKVVEMGLTTTTLLTTENFPVLVPNSLFSSQVIVNKSRAKYQAMITKIPLEISDFDMIPKISEDIKNMLKSNTNVFIEEEAPYCFLSRIERSFAELTLGCNLKATSKSQLFSAQQDILLQSVQIIKQHGATLGRFAEDMNNL